MRPSLHFTREHMHAASMQHDECERSSVDLFLPLTFCTLGLYGEQTV
jgi:hypothetical protein